jgi:pyruvate dehydrogenase E2 component (dihydrolipoyllysine-residue acetyltransferase)
LAENHRTAKGETRVEELSKLGQTAARRVAESKATIPHIHLSAEVEFGAEETGDELTIRACGLALRDHPLLNGSYRDGSVELHSRINVGIAMQSAEGVVVPTIFDADLKTTTEIAAELADLAGRVGNGSLTSPELAGGTFTLFTQPEPGIRGFSAAILPPQAALLAAGPVVERPVIRDGAVVAAPVIDLTLACDARVVDPAAGAAFLAQVGDLLGDQSALAR